MGFNSTQNQVGSTGGGGAVTGTVSISGLVGVSGTVSVSGAVTTTGTVSVSGTVTTSGFVTVSGTVTVGAHRVDQGVASAVAWPVFTSQAVSGVVSVSGTVSGNVSISGTVSGVFSVSGAVSGVQSISGPVGVNQGAASGVAWPVFTSQIVSAVITGTVSVSGAVGMNQGAASSTAWPAIAWATSTNSATTCYRSTIASTTVSQINATSARIFGWQLSNRNTNVAFVHFYGLTAASVTVGTTTPWKSVMVPNSGVNVVDFSVPRFVPSGFAHAVTASPSGTTAMSTPVELNVDWAP
jgi:hypothetical protein